MKKDFITLAVVIIFVVLLGLFFALSPRAPELSYLPVEVEGGSITVTDQEQLEYVRLSAELSEPGFITIHQSMSDAPAAVIGTSRYLEAGVHDDLVITLSEEMLPGYKYITLLHVDNGDGYFVMEEDLPTAVNGEVVRPDFIAVGPQEEGLVDDLGVVGDEEEAESEE